MLKKFFMIMLGVFIFLICPNVEAREIDVKDIIVDATESGSIGEGTISFDEELSPGDIFTFANYGIEYSFNFKYVLIYLNQEYQFEQSFSNVDGSKDSYEYKVLSYQEIFGKELEKGQNVKITGQIRQDMGSGLIFKLSIYYQIIDDVEKQVVYNNTFGVENINPTTYYEGETDILLKDIEREGYKFLGWYTSPTFEEDTRITMISKDEPDVLSLYAKWEKIEDENIITNPNTNSSMYIGIGILFILILSTILIIVYRIRKVS